MHGAHATHRPHKSIIHDFHCTENRNTRVLFDVQSSILFINLFVPNGFELLIRSNRTKPYSVQLTMVCSWCKCYQWPSTHTTARHTHTRSSRSSSGSREIWCSLLIDSIKILLLLSNHKSNPFSNAQYISLSSAFCCTSHSCCCIDIRHATLRLAKYLIWTNQIWQWIYGAFIQNEMFRWRVYV